MSATAIERTVLVPIHITESRIDRLVQESLKASTYWAEVASDYGDRVLLRVLDGEGQSFSKVLLSDQAIERGLRLLSYEQPDLFAEVLSESDAESYARAADMFLQFAVFGTIVYS